MALQIFKIGTTTDTLTYSSSNHTVSENAESSRLMISILLPILSLILIGVRLLLCLKKKQSKVENSIQLENEFDIEAETKMINTRHISLGTTDAFIPTISEFGLLNLSGGIENEYSSKNVGINLSSEQEDNEGKKIVIRQNKLVGEQKYKIEIIISPDPVKHEMMDYYHTIRDNSIDVIVRLGQGIHFSSSLVGISKAYGPMTVKFIRRFLIHDFLFRTDILIMTDEYLEPKHIQNVVFYDFTSFPTDEIWSSAKTHDLVSAICIIQQQLKQWNKNITILTHDPKDGLESSSVFVCLLDLIAKIEEKSYDAKGEECLLQDTDVIETINNFRNKKEGIIESYENFKLLFYCLDYYVKHKGFFNRLQPKGLRMNPGDLNLTKRHT